MSSHPLSTPPPEDAPFRYEITRDGEHAHLRCVGDLDIAGVEALSAELERLHGCRNVIYDLSDLDFIDSTGLRFLLDRYAASREDGVTMAIRPGSVAVQRVFDATRTSAHLPFARD